MKRTLSLLLLVIVLVYAKQGYDLYLSNLQATALKGTLSDITEEVVAIPLQTADDLTIDKARNIRQQGNNMFLVSNDVLYRFTTEGAFVCRITDPHEIRVAGYVLNQRNEELIVLGNDDDIFYYSFDGVLKHKKKLKSNLQGHRLQSLTLIHDQIWTVEEYVQTNEDTMETTVSKRVVTYNSSFHPLYSQALQPVDVGRNRLLPAMCQPQLCIDGDTGQVYAYAPDMHPDHILRDTLHLLGTWRGQFTRGKDAEAIPLCPVRTSGRFWLASYANPSEPAHEYTFCYDSQRRTYCEVKGGLTDDFYHTGQVADLEAMDCFNQRYAFCRSGEAAKKAFPDGKANGQAVVFILKMKA